jgi:ankyrin repeat protein
MDLIDAINACNEKLVLENIMLGADVMCCDDADRITPLHHAISTSTNNIVSILLFFDADPHAASGDSGETPLDRAVRLRRFDLVRLMLGVDAEKILH